MFTSKSQQKAQLSILARQYEKLRDRVQGAILSEADARFPDRADVTQWTLRHAFINDAGYWDIPLYPHQWRERHASIVKDPAVLDEILGVLEGIKAVKAQPIVKVAPKADPREVKIRESILELMARRKQQYARALDIGDIFGGLPVTANVHVVVNARGTRFLRAFYYLAGEFTPVNVIIAAAQERERKEASNV